MVGKKRKRIFWGRLALIHKIHIHSLSTTIDPRNSRIYMLPPTYTHDGTQYQAQSDLRDRSLSLFFQTLNLKRKCQN